jgi:hypothetical protein
MIATLVYLGCAITSVACAGLLIRGWRRSGASLLLWCSLGFTGLAINNLLLFVDKVLVPDVDMSMYRAVTGFAAVAILLGGLVWNAE